MCPRQPWPTRQSQSPPRPPSVRSVRASPPSATPQPRSTTIPSAKATPDVTCDIFTEAVTDGYRPLDRNVDLNPVLALEELSKRPDRRSCRYQGRHGQHPRGASEGRISGSALNLESPTPPLPPRTASSTPAESRKPRKEAPQGCFVCYEALAVSMVHLGSGPHRLHRPHYAALRVRATVNLRALACTATVTV